MLEHGARFDELAVYAAEESKIGFGISGGGPMPTSGKKQGWLAVNAVDATGLPQKLSDTRGDGRVSPVRTNAVEETPAPDDGDAKDAHPSRAISWDRVY
jgi:hypothetical protein